MDNIIEAWVWTECALCQEIMLAHDKAETIVAHGRMHLAHADCVAEAVENAPEEDDKD